MPILRLARLAVDVRARGLGIGEQLLKFVLNLAVRLADELGCLGGLVDAKADAVSFYEKYGFERLELQLGEAEARPIPTAMFLPLKDIDSARKP
jgi:GNAT superfamily N-acetyltransferase